MIGVTGGLRIDLPRRGVLEVGLAILAAAAVAGFVFSLTVDVARGYYSPGGGCVYYDASEFESLLGARGPALAVMFSSDTCPVCREMEPSWLALCRDPPAGVRVLVLKLSRSTVDLFVRYSVTETPTFIVFVGGEPVSRHVGAFVGGNVTQAMLEWILSSTGGAGGGGTAAPGAGGPSTPVNPPGGGLAVAGPLAALLAGLVAALSPCVYPLLASYLASLAASGGAGRGWWLPLKASLLAATGALAVGAAFLALGGVSARVNAILLPTSAIVLMAAGLLELAGIPAFINVNFRVGRSFEAFTLLYGALSVQCSFPLVAGALLLVAGGGYTAGLPALAGFAAGIAWPVGVAAWASTSGRLGGGILYDRVRRYASAALVAAGAYLLAYSMGLA